VDHRLAYGRPAGQAQVLPVIGSVRVATVLTTGRGIETAADQRRDVRDALGTMVAPRRAVSR